MLEEGVFTMRNAYKLSRMHASRVLAATLRMLRMDVNTGQDIDIPAASVALESVQFWLTVTAWASGDSLHTKLACASNVSAGFSSERLHKSVDSVPPPPLQLLLVY